MAKFLAVRLPVTSQLVEQFVLVGDVLRPRTWRFSLHTYVHFQFTVPEDYSKSLPIPPHSLPISQVLQRTRPQTLVFNNNSPKIPVTLASPHRASLETHIPAH